MHSAALLAQENANLRGANEKKRQKRTRSNRQLAHEGGLTVEVGLQLVQQLNQPFECGQPLLLAQADQPIQLVQSTPGRGPQTCSGCREVRRIIIFESNKGFWLEDLFSKK
jgi:hypothetical protein